MFEVIPMLLLSQFQTFRMVLDLPSMHTLRVLGTKRQPRIASRYLIHGLPERLHIHGDSDKGKFSFEIDLESGLPLVHSWGELTGQGRGGSGDIGIILFGLPTLILTMPIWLTVGFIHRLVQASTGMDFHLHGVYLKLRDQLHPDEAEILRLAFRAQTTQWYYPEEPA